MSEPGAGQGPSVAPPVDEWQRRLLPLMGLVLVGAALFFAWVSVSEFSDLKARIAPPKVDLTGLFERFETSEAAKPVIGRFDYLQWKSAVYLEQEAIRHRYAQGNSTVLARVWTRLLGFTTGMILAIVGAAFILGKLREDRTELKQETEALKVSLATTSPGIVLAVLGSVLMGITLLSKFDIEIRDVPVYVAPRAAAPDLPNFPALMRPSRDTTTHRPPAAGETDPAKGGTP
jgi:hypothetical protein